MSRRPFLFGIAVLGGLLIVHSAAAALRQPSRWPNALEKGRYQARIAETGKILWTVDWETRVQDPQNLPQVEIVEKGAGQPWKYRQPITWQKKMVFSAPQPETVRVESVQGERRDTQGHLLSEMEVRMDPSSGRILYRDSQAGEVDRPVTLPWDPQALPDELLFHWARTLPFEQKGGANAECLLLVSPKQQFRIQARVRGTEQVTTPAGTFPCYRVELVPRLLGPLKALAPRMTLWCRVDPPHSWVRYQGPVGGPGSPQVVIELVRFDED